MLIQLEFNRWNLEVRTNSENSIFILYKDHNSSATVFKELEKAISFALDKENLNDFEKQGVCFDVLRSDLMEICDYPEYDYESIRLKYQQKNLLDYPLDEIRELTSYILSLYPIRNWDSFLSVGRQTRFKGDVISIACIDDNEENQHEQARIINNDQEAAEEAIKIGFVLDDQNTVLGFGQIDLTAMSADEIKEVLGKKETIVPVNQDQPKPTIDLNKDSWGVLNDMSQRFKDTALKFMSDNHNRDYNGLHKMYYGKDMRGNWDFWGSKEKFTHILTLDDFCALAYPKEEGSELIGKWVRCTQTTLDNHKKNGWYKVTELTESVINVNNKNNRPVPWSIPLSVIENYFDLNNPLDYNPEMLVGKYYQGAKIEKIEMCHLDLPVFVTNAGDVPCSDITPSDVTNEPPVKSLKYENCFERVQPKFYVNYEGKVNNWHDHREDCVATERQAKQAAAMLKLMTICQDANEGWVPKCEERRYLASYNESDKQVIFILHATSINSPIYFRDNDTAQRAYEANKDIFHAYFGINE